MSTEMEQLFETLLTLGGVQSLIGLNESAVLECKTWPVRDDEAQKKILAKALSGFANAAGGVLVLGVDARSQGRDEPDSISELKPIDDRQRVKSRFLELAGQLVEPAVHDLRIEDVASSSGGSSGFVVVLIPGTDGPPVRSRKDWRFYLRIGSGTYPMEYFQIADIFGRRRRPVLSLHLEEAGVEMRKGRPVRILTLGIENRGRAIAKYPSIRFRSSAVGVDPLGIDGKGGSGLPRSPSEPSWVVFGGGADHVIHPATLLEITKVEQYVGTWLRNVGTNAVEAVHFSELSLCAWVAADEFPSTGESKTIPAETIRIENVNQP